MFVSCASHHSFGILWLPHYVMEASLQFATIAKQYCLNDNNKINDLHESIKDILPKNPVLKFY